MGLEFGLGTDLQSGFQKTCVATLTAALPAQPTQSYRKDTVSFRELTG